MRRRALLAASAASGGKMVNVIVVFPLTSGGVDIRAQYPVASNVWINLNINGTFSPNFITKIVLRSGNSAANVKSFGPGESFESINYWEPREDDTYIYNVILNNL